MLTFDRVTEDDLPELNELFRELTGSLADPGAMRRSFAGVASDERVVLLAGRDESGRIVATAMGIVANDLVWECKPFMWVENVVVASSARGRGAGRELMAEIERVARERGCSFVSLVSSESREDAHSFYESIGYCEDPVRGFRKML